MTNSENIVQFGPNAYSKPATGLNILRETIMGRELFDYSYKEYSRRWAFKHPTPADFFRTMEDASAVDLDWFWRGWFYGIEPCDIALDSVRSFKIGDAQAAAPRRGGSDTMYVAKPMLNPFEDLSKIRNREDKNIVFQTDADTSLRDFYWYYARGLKKVDNSPIVRERTAPEATTAEDLAPFKDKWFYELHFTNKGGLVMPLIIEWTFTDGTKEVERIPAEIWRKNELEITKAFMKNKEVASVMLDPMRETADINETNNRWPQVSAPSRFQLFKGGFRNRNAGAGAPNPMQREIK
jgi:AAA+ ATPase superfamily predicted ATPase